MLALHGIPLAATVGDYRVSIDSGYHVSLARHYAEHGFRAWWDPINYGPAGRPNLQGPLIHMAIGALGKLLGGSGDAYVLANTLLAFSQWVAAMATLVFFARRYGGDRAALFAAALLSGALASLSFAVGLPSGWIFIATPWAIHFFLEDRLSLSTLCAVAGIYCHLGGYLTAPVGILIAAILTSRFRALLVVGAATLLLTLPYTIHLLRYDSWYRGGHGHVSTTISPLAGLLALSGLVLLLRRFRQNVFLLAWAFAPIVWLFQDYTRFVNQSMLAGAAIGGILLARAAGRLEQRWRTVLAVAIVLVATVYPLAIPALGAELRLVAGLDYPRSMEWSEAKALARVLERDRLTERLVYCYSHSFGPALAVWTRIQLEKGHWVEVQPRPDPASDLPAGAKVYVLPLPPSDPTLAELAAKGWVTVYGGTERSTVVTMAGRPGLSEAARVTSDIAARESAWLSEHARNNKLDPAGEVLFSKEGISRRRAWLREQRFHAGRVELAILLYAYAAEAIDSRIAKGMRSQARGWASLATFLSDEASVNFIGEDRHERLKQNLRQWSSLVRSLGETVTPTPELNRATDKLFDEYFWAA